MKIDVKAGKIVDDTPGGTMGFVTWERLFTEVFKRAGELMPGETVTHVEVGKGGFTFRIQRP
ncbi:hypothetical protein EVC29_108 [Rhizobium phage RHph_Y52]|nr:hypothetical protein EVC16_108 [Rhizobium phage RHph_Y21]QIG76809.1 hypothetical protein EVC29_108 [Rhizobium phage RHph_Y52]